MASSKDFLNYILEQTEPFGDITYRAMMGEFLLYFKGILFGGIYDDRLLVKKTKTNATFGLLESIPYEGARPMYLVENIDDKEYLKNLIISTCKDLK